MTMTAGEALLLSGASVAAVGLLGIGWAWGADADMCGSLATLETKLRADYGETQLWTGKSGKTGVIVRLYVSPEKGTWTAAVVKDQRACIVDLGDAARIGEAMPEGDPS